MRVPTGPSAPGSVPLVPYAPPVKKASVTKPLDFLVLVLLPWLIFSLIVSLFAFSFQDFAPLVWALVAASALLGALFISMGVSRNKVAQVALGFLILAAVGLAVPIGLHLVSRYMAEFFSIDYGANYKGVSPDAPGASFLDASTIEFASGSSVDAKRSLGYMKFGSVYCVAPIRGKTGDNASPAFWAVGMGCCERKGGRFTCGDQANEVAHSGVRVNDGRANYVNAVRMASAAYSNLTAVRSEELIFVRWTADTSAYRDKLWNSATMFATTASAVHLLGSSGAGLLLSRCSLR
mmetsp:Transcript_16404/g.46969  ORF Transcript_16404/g.46969 Transcript_16404/m.46969 type:complete len:293 (+) Transcript_16404:139-1017(+)